MINKTLGKKSGFQQRDRETQRQMRKLAFSFTAGLIYVNIAAPGDNDILFGMEATLFAEQFNHYSTF